MLQKIRRRLKKYLTLFYRKFKTRQILNHLKKSEDEDIRKLAIALDFIHSRLNLSVEEASILKEIDEIKKNYSESRKIVNLIDYGAGSPHSARQAEEMRKGVSENAVVTDIYRIASTMPKWGTLLFRLIRDFKPGHCLELGTCLGVSALYQLAALKLNHKGKLITIEGSAELADLAAKNLEKINYPFFMVHKGRFKDVLPSVISDNQQIDFAFIDGHHDRKATMEYFEMIYPALGQKAILVFDDINWSSGMTEFWNWMCTDIRIKACFDLYKWGICLIDKSNSSSEEKIFRLAIK